MRQVVNDMNLFSSGNDTLFQSIIAEAPLGIISVADTGHILSCNHAASSTFGYREEEIIGKSFPILFPTIHGSTFHSLFQQGNQSIPSYNQEWIGLHKNGASFSIDVHTTIITNSTPRILAIYVKQNQSQKSDLYQSLFEQNPFLVYSTDLQGRIFSLNHASEQILGYSAHELIGRSYQDLMMFEEDRTAESIRFRRVLQGGHYKLEIPFCNKRGHLIYICLISFPKVFESQVVGVYFMGFDITARKQTERALMMAQEDLKNTLQMQKGMTFKFIKSGKEFIYTMADGELLYRLGLTPEYVVGRRMQDVLPYLQSKRSYYEKAWQGETVSYEENVIGVCYVASLRPIMRNDRVVEVIASCIDITERKKAEEELRSTKDLLESLFTNSTDAIYVLDLDGTVLRINHAFEKMYGWSSDEVVGRPLHDFVPNDSQQMIFVCRDKQENDYITSYETLQERRDGSKIYVSLSLSPIHDATGRIVGTATISRDITERKATEQLLLNSEKLSAIGELAAGVAHEIRNPLAALRGFVQLLRSSVKDYQPYFQIMLTELDRINMIVSELLVLSKPQVLRLQRKSLHQLLTSVVLLLQTQAIISNVQVLLEFGEDDPYVECEENQLKQVFINLLKNSLEAMDSGGIIQITVSTKEESTYIQVVDQGCGIPDELISQLGQPFISTKEKGTGLGLMITQKIIKEHRGNLSITSEVGKGTTITIRLPLAHPPVI
nr:PAS domain S-box protein [Brevibacillus laterosporus]